MQSIIIAVALLSPSFAAVIPSKANDQSQFPVKDGFPTPNSQQLSGIFAVAHGTLPNSPIPKFNPDTYKTLQVIATNEQIEVSFYEKCLVSIQSRAPGFGDDAFPTEADRQFAIATFRAFYAQEEIHTEIAQGGLQANGQTPIKPSVYNLKLDTYQDCLSIANVIGDNVLATSVGAIQRAVEVGDGGLAAQLDSLVAQEGEQGGWVRSQQLVNGKHTRIPAAMPAYTGGTREYLFSLLQTKYIKPGSDQNKIDLPVFLTLDVVNKNIQPAVNQDLQFTINLNTVAGNNATASGGKYDANYNWRQSNLYLTYITGQRLPVSEPLKNVVVNKAAGTVAFTACFPAADNYIHAFAIGALTIGNNFTGPVQMVNSTIAGPASIELVD